MGKIGKKRVGDRTPRTRVMLSFLPSFFLSFFFVCVWLDFFFIFIINYGVLSEGKQVGLC